MPEFGKGYIKDFAHFFALIPLPEPGLAAEPRRNEAL